MMRRRSDAKAGGHTVGLSSTLGKFTAAKAAHHAPRLYRWLMLQRESELLLPSRAEADLPVPLPPPPSPSPPPPSPSLSSQTTLAEIEGLTETADVSSAAAAASPTTAASPSSFTAGTPAASLLFSFSPFLPDPSTAAALDFLA